MKRIYLLSIVLFLVSCSTKIELNIPESEPKIVVNGLITNDTTITVNISKTFATLTGELEFVDNAQISLWEDDIFIENLQYSENGNYTSQIIVQTGKEYKITVNVPEFETISASTQIPEPVAITDGTIYIDAYFDQNQKVQASEILLSFNDPQEEINYYLTTFYAASYIEIWDSITNTVILTDSVYSYYGIYYLNSNEQVILNEDDIKYYEGAGKIRSLVFSDELLSTENTLSFFAEIPYIYNGNQFAILRSISYDYYMYHKSRIRQRFSQGMGSLDATNMFLSSNPNDLYSNITNGIGIFAGYSEAQFELQEIQQ